MSDNVRADRDLLFVGSDLTRPRMAVEREKLSSRFPQFAFYGSGNAIHSVRGMLTTSYGHSYHVRLDISENYPYRIPSAWVVSPEITGAPPHRYSDGSICLWKADQWSSVYSLAFAVAKMAIWLNKYDSWRISGIWRGREQRH